jgi:hypothetical protein
MGQGQNADADNHGENKRQKVSSAGTTLGAPQPSGQTQIRDLREAREVHSLLSFFRSESGGAMHAERLSLYYHHLKILSKDASAQGKKTAKELLTKLGKRILPLVGELTPKQLITLIGGHGALGQIFPSDLLHAVRDRIIASILMFSGRDVANCVWNLARIKQNVTRAVLDKLCQRLSDTITSCKFLVLKCHFCRKFCMRA